MADDLAVARDEERLRDTGRPELPRGPAARILRRRIGEAEGRAEAARLRVLVLDIESQKEHSARPEPLGFRLDHPGRRSARVTPRGPQAENNRSAAELVEVELA